MIPKANGKGCKPMNTVVIRRFSPISLPAAVKERVQAGGYDVVLRCEDEGPGPWVVDLSHRTKWDVQNGSLDKVRAFGKSLPNSPGQCAVIEGWLVNRMNRVQAAMWDIAANSPGAPIPEHYATETTDGICLLALVGENLQRVMEKLTTLDCFPPGRTAPYLIQGPVLHIPMQVVVLTPGVVLTAFSRGYGQAVVEALLGSCKEFSIRPGGEKRFMEAFQS
jgi:hypothetical protein